MALLSAFFGALALLIAAIGLAGMVSYSVSRRRSEIGIRAALGATRSSLIGLVMRDVAVITAAGLIAGVTAGFASGSFISTMLYGLEPDDPSTAVIAAAVLGAVAVLAGYIPARRAAKIDPIECLRSE